MNQLTPFGQTAAGDCPIISPDLFHKYLSAEWTTSMGNYFDHTADFWSLGVIVWKMLKGIENYEDPAASLFSFPSWDAHGCRVAYFWYEQMKTLMAAEQKREKARAEKSGRPTTLAARKAAWQRAYARWAAIAFNKYIRLKELDGISKEARSFILNLLVVDPEKRLGGGPRTQTLARRAKEGWRKVLCHPWLASIDKVQLMQHGMLQAKHFNEPIVWDTPDGKIPAEPEGWLKRKEAAKAVASPPMSVTSEADARNEAPGMVVRPIVITDPAGDVKAEGERPLYATSFSPGLESTGNAVSAFGNGNRGGLRTSKGGAQNAESGGRSYATTFTTGFGGNVDANDEDESPVDYDSSEEDE
jgi:serine/threonine protein kinase